MATTSTGSVLSQAIATTDSADKELLLRQILDQPAGNTPSLSPLADDHTVLDNPNPRDRSSR